MINIRKTVKEYQQFLEAKIVVAESYGQTIDKSLLNETLLPHQKDIVHWAISGGRRAIFASFGLGKTVMQIELAVQVMKLTGKPFLICMPLGVVGEFRDDNDLLNTGFELKYITDTDLLEVDENDGNYEFYLKPAIYVTNYERVRKGDIDPKYFGGVSFDEASILRNLKTETTNYVLKHFRSVHYRFVATATPTPNDFIEILNYADYLGVIDRGHALTRFFQRDPVKAGSLTLYPNKKEEFWKWVSTWAVFINKPSDLGYSDEGYNLPKLNLHEIEVENLKNDVIRNKQGDIVLFKDNTKSLVDVSREKSESIQLRVDKAFEIVQTDNAETWILWSHLEAERHAIEKKFKEDDFIELRSVFGSQKNSEKEQLLIDFKHTKYQILNTKPKIAGSGCNFQHACHKMVFVGIDYKFNDFIQAVHRVYRFRQQHEVDIFVIFTQNERDVLKTLKEKWRKHIELQTEMINLVREYGLNTDKITEDMKRKIFADRRTATIGDAIVYNEDTTIIHREMADNSTDMILTSIPFGDHFEYSDNYNDFGHNDGNEEFFKQMDFLTPDLLRTLKPGRIAAIHVKDRIRYSYQNGTSFTTIEDFSGQTVAHFTKEHVKAELRSVKSRINDFVPLLKQFKADENHPAFEIIKDQVAMLNTEKESLEKDYENRFYLVGKITVTTDVVRENNQTYRLGHSEQCKDATKMGVGMPEYVLLFRKRPSEMNNAYADTPVLKGRNINDRLCLTCNQPVDLKNSKESKTVDGNRVCKTCKESNFQEFAELYPLDRWQLDAHAYWKTDGDRFLTSKEMNTSEFKTIFNAWRKYDKEHIYNFQEHLRICQDLDGAGKLSKLFMSLPPTSNNDEMVWTDINRMLTLNANQVNRKKEKHICPLQLDIITRLILRFTNEGDVVDDPFGGLFSTAYKALELRRKAISAELNPDYYDDGLFYLKSIEYKINVPTLFDMIA